MKNTKSARSVYIKNTIITLGVAILVIGWSVRDRQKRALSFDSQISAHETHASNPIPKSIQISGTNIDLEIETGVIESGVWSISAKGASHLASSASPGDGGNIVIYAHNKNHLFGPIRQLDVDEEILIVNSVGDKYTYKITETQTVNPNEIDYVLPKEMEVLTLYTCTGFADSKRHIVIAKPI
ncbi:sortase [Patescibacteria group bacterium]